MSNISNGKSSNISLDTSTYGVDTYERLRTSKSYPLLSVHHANNVEQNLVHATSGSSFGTSGQEFTASYNHNRSSYYLQPGTGSGDILVRQTKEYYSYSIGISQNCLISFASMQADTNVRKRIGYFDADDGVFLETSDTDTNIVLRSSIGGSVQETRVSQSAWNADPLDGNSRSKISIDLNKGNIFCIDYQWLGTGRIRTGFNLDGKTHVAHVFNNTNTKPSAYMKTPSLPIRYEIENLSTSTASATLEQLCASVLREDGEAIRGYRFPVLCFNEGTTATTSERSMLSVRLKSDFNRVTLRFIKATFFNKGNVPVLFKVVLNPTFTSGSFTWTNSGPYAQRSITQLDYSPGSGHTIISDFTDSTSIDKESLSSKIDNILNIVSDVDGNSDILTIIAQSQSGTQDVDASLGLLADI